MGKRGAGRVRGDAGRRRMMVAALALVLALFVAIVTPADAAPAGGEARLPRDCDEGVHGSGNGALFRICTPLVWNGDLVVFAHGYVPPDAPIALPDDQLLIGGEPLADLFNDLGYAFAVTSYSRNGLAIQEGVADIADLVEVFRAREGDPNRVYLVGVSEGGVVSTLATERYPWLFDGAIAACAPNGSFQSQINYGGDVRVLFDHYFPGVLPGSVVAVPAELVLYWEGYYGPLVRGVVTHPAHAATTLQFLKAARIPVDPNDAEAVADTVEDLLRISTRGAYDMVLRLGGNPFDNTRRWYFGTGDDAALNAGIVRYVADPAAIAALAAYETSGLLDRPLTVLHTTLDPLVLYWQAEVYTEKVRLAARTDQHRLLPVERFGHCAFTSAEAVYAFGTLVRAVTGSALAAPARALHTPEQRRQYQDLQRRHGTR